MKCNILIKVSSVYSRVAHSQPVGLGNVDGVYLPVTVRVGRGDPHNAGASAEPRAHPPRRQRHRVEVLEVTQKQDGFLVYLHFQMHTEHGRFFGMEELIHFRTKLWHDLCAGDLTVSAIFTSPIDIINNNYYYYLIYKTFMHPRACYTAVQLKILMQ